MTYAPRSLLDAREYLQSRTGLSAVALGITGDSRHRGGYHHGKPNVPATDYSRDESPRDENGLTGAASALDIGAFAKGGKTLQGLSLWIVGQCKAGAPDTRDIREVIYSPDGRAVKRWDRLGHRTSGDSSHLKHTHISYHRDAEARDKVSLFKRYFEGTPSDLPGGIMLPNYGDSGRDVKYWQRLLLEAGEKLPRYGRDGKYGDEMKSAIMSWYLKHDGDPKAFDGKTVTDWVAASLQKAVFGGGVSSADLAAAVTAYLTANPVTVPARVRVDLGTVEGTLTGAGE